MDKWISRGKGSGPLPLSACSMLISEWSG